VTPPILAPGTGSGGPATTLATGQVNPDAIAVDETSVYWIDNGSTVMKFTPK
jgi:hypothetical protein